MKTNKELKEEILDILNTIEVSYDCGITVFLRKSLAKFSRTK